MTYYKLARPDGWDFRTGSTINYREAIGGKVTAPDWEKNTSCGNGLHYCKDPLDCFVGARVPCSAYIVRPTRTNVAIDGQKSKARTLHVLEEVTDLNSLFGFNYTEACDPFDPLSLTTKPNEQDLALLAEWDSVWGSVRDSVWGSVGASVWGSVRDPVWDSVWDSVRGSVRDSVWGSVGASVWGSVRDAEAAYIGSLFPKIERWVYAPPDKPGYPYQSAVDLIYRGLVPSYNYTDKKWRLHTGPNAKIVWEGTL